MYLELNNLFIFDGQNCFNTNIEDEIKKLNNTGISDCYTYLNNTCIRISIKRSMENQYSVTYFKYNNTTGKYNDLVFDSELVIDNNRPLIKRITTFDGNTNVLYFKGQTGIRFIKSVYCKNNYPTNYPTHSEYVIEQSNATCQDEFESLCNQQYYNEHNCASLISINGIGEPQIVINKNGIDFINNILRQQVQKSDGFNYGLYSQLNYNWIILKYQQHINNIRLFPELGKEYFSKPKKLNEFLSDFGLKLLQRNDQFTQNFAIIPVCADGHISTLLLDLRPDISQQIPERLYSFDSSLYHYKQNIFGDSISKDHKLSTQSLQLTCCCGYWTSCFIEECSEIEDIEEVKQQFKTGEMQLKAACKVSEIIDKGVGNNGLLRKRIEQEGKYKGDNNYITINIKGTNKYFLLDRKNVYKSTCVDLEAIYNLIQQESSQLEILGGGLAKLKEQIIKQNQELFKIKQTRINEIKEQIEPIKEILEMELEMYKLNNLHHEKLAMLNSSQSVEASKTLMNINTLNKLFCSNLAKFEHLKKRIKLNSDRQREYLSIQEKLGYNNLVEYLKGVVDYGNLAEYFEELGLFFNNLMTYTAYNKLYDEYNKNYEKLQQSSPDLKYYFEQQQRYYNRLFTIEQRNIKNTQNDYFQMPNLNQLQLDELNRCILEIEKSSIKNSKTTQLTK